MANLVELFDENAALVNSYTSIRTAINNVSADNHTIYVSGDPGNSYIHLEGAVLAFSKAGATGGLNGLVISGVDTGSGKPSIQYGAGDVIQVAAGDFGTGTSIVTVRNLDFKQTDASTSRNVVHHTSNNTNSQIRFESCSFQRASTVAGSDETDGSLMYVGHAGSSNLIDLVVDGCEFIGDSDLLYGLWWGGVTNTSGCFIKNSIFRDITNGVAIQSQISESWNQPLVVLKNNTLHHNLVSFKTGARDPVTNCLFTSATSADFELLEVTNDYADQDFFTYCGFEGAIVASGANNFAVTATDEYTNVATSDLTLKTGATSKDNGDNSVSAAGSLNVVHDFLGNVRPFGSVYDVGAYEFGASAPTGSITITHISPDSINHVNVIEISGNGFVNSGNEPVVTAGLVILDKISYSNTKILFELNETLDYGAHTITVISNSVHSDPHSFEVTSGAVPTVTTYLHSHTTSADLEWNLIGTDFAITSGHDKTTADPELLLRFNANNNDDSGNGHIMTDVGGSTYTSGYHTCAIDFDGSTQSMTTDISGADMAGKSLTFSTWIYPTSFSTHNPIFYYQTAAASHKFTARLQTNGLMYISWAGGGSEYGFGHSSPVLAVNNWYHICVVYDKDEPFVKLYIDNILVSTNTSVGSSVGVSGDLINIGLDVSNGNKFQGKMDNFKFYTSAIGAHDRALLSHQPYFELNTSGIDYDTATSTTLSSDSPSELEKGTYSFTVSNNYGTSTTYNVGVLSSTGTSGDYDESDSQFTANITPP